MPEAVERLRDDMNFVRLGGKTFTITEVAVPSIDRMMGEMKRTYEERCNLITSALQREFVQDANVLSTAEHQRILQEVGAGAISVPPNRFGLPMVVVHNTLQPVRNVLMAHTHWSGTLSAWMDRIEHGHALWGKIDAFMHQEGALAAEETLRHKYERRTSEVKMYISGIPDVRYCQACMFTKHADKLLMSREAYHTMSSYYTANGFDWKYMCIGNSPVDQYWNDTHFMKNVCAVNMDSLAKHTVSMNGMNVSVAQYVVNLKEFSVSVVEPEGGWDA